MKLAAWREVRNRVSILVFLELALRLPFMGRGFLRLNVSILVFLELALRLCGSSRASLLYTGFQSLFSWNSLFDLAQHKALLRPAPVSILVFLELALRR